MNSVDPSERTSANTIHLKDWLISRFRRKGKLLGYGKPKLLITI